jgi:hypothetical protein
LGISDFPRISGFGIRIFNGVRQFHDVIEIVLGTADLEDMHQAFVRAGDGLEALDPAELAFEGAVVFENMAVNDLDGAQCPESVPSQPDFAVAAPANLSEQLMIGDLGRLGGWACRSRFGSDRAGRGGGVEICPHRDWAGACGFRQSSAI